MKPSQDLFDLVRSLTKGEKIYFRKYCSLHVIGEGNKYLRLFDAVARMDEYDEKKLVARLKDRMLAKNIHVYKTYLYRLILRCLNRFHEERYVNSRIMEILQHVEILFDKGLYLQSSKQVARAKSLAAEFEKYGLLGEILTWEIRLTLFHPNSEGVSDRMEALFADKQDAREILENADELLMVHNRIYVLQRGLNTSKAVLKDDVEEAIRLSASPLFSKPENARSFYALQSYYFTRLRVHQLQHNYDASYEIQKELLKQFMKRPMLIPENIAGYFAVAFEGTFMQHYMEEFGEAGKRTLYDQWEKFKSLDRAAGSTHYRMLMLLKEAELELLETEMSEDYSTLDQIARKFSDGIKEFGRLLDHERIYANAYTLAYLYFYAGEYRKTIQWLTRLLHLEAPQYIGLKATTRIVFLLAHYQVGNSDLLPALMRRNERQLEKWGHLNTLEKLILSTLKKLHRAKDKTGRKTIAEDALHELHVLTAAGEFRIELRYFDYTRWLKIID